MFTGVPGDPLSAVEGFAPFFMRVPRDPLSAVKCSPTIFTMVPGDPQASCGRSSPNFQRGPWGPLSIVEDFPLILSRVPGDLLSDVGGFPQFLQGSGGSRKRVGGQEEACGVPKDWRVLTSRVSSLLQFSLSLGAVMPQARGKRVVGRRKRVGVTKAWRILTSRERHLLQFPTIRFPPIFTAVPVGTPQGSPWRRLSDVEE